MLDQFLLMACAGIQHRLDYFTIFVSVSCFLIKYNIEKR